MKKAVIYTRVSTEEQAESGTSLETQQEKCRMQAAVQDAVVIAVCTDEGISGTRYQTRKGIQQALCHIENREADTLLIYRIDRLGRAARIILDIAERVDRAGGRIVTCDGQEIGGSPVGKMMLTMLAAIAEFERNTIRERSANAKRKRAEQGLQPSRAYSPFGYHIVTRQDAIRGDYPDHQPGEYVLLEDQAHWIREMYRWCLEGASLREICRRLQANGIAAPKGGRNWVPITVKTVLENPVNMGRPAHGRTRTHTDESRLLNGYKRDRYQRRTEPEQWIFMEAPAIVDEATWTAAVARMKANKNTLSGNPGRRFLLSGLLRCPRCGQSMSGGMCKGTGYYQCCKSRTYRNVTGDVCNRKSRRADALESLLIRDIKTLARQPEQFSAALRTFHQKQQERAQEPQEAERLRRELAELNRQEEAAAKAQVDALMKGRETLVYDRLLSDIDARRKPLRERLTALAIGETQAASETIETEAERIAEVLRRVEAVLEAEEITVAEKHAALSTLIAAIRPLGDDHEAGYEVELRSYEETVQCMVQRLS